MPLWNDITYTRPDTNVAFMLIYGVNNVGKTCSVLSTCKLPCLYVLGEPRNIWRNIDAANEVRNAAGAELLIPGENLYIYEYDTFDDLITFLHEHSGIDWGKLNTIVIDSLTYIMGSEFMSEIVDESHEGRKTKGKLTVKEYSSMFKSTTEDYGVLANGMTRLVKAVGRNARKAISVICLATEDEKQMMVEGSYRKVPLFAGAKFSKEMGDAFDLIGRVTPNIKIVKGKDGKDARSIEYPPIVSFASPNGEFQAKWTGLCPSLNKVFYFDLNNILK